MLYLGLFRSYTSCSFHIGVQFLGKEFGLIHSKRFTRASCLLFVGSFVVGCLALRVRAEGEVLPVFVLAGQSNMEGVGLPRELPENLKGPHENVLFVKFWSVRFKPLDLHGKPRFGPELTFGLEMAKALGRRVGIIKIAYGGTSIERRWNPLVYDKKKHIGDLYRRLIGYVKGVKKKNPHIKIMGMVWMQGEADARYHAKRVDQYKKKLEALIEGCRKEFGCPNMPFVCGRVNPPKKRYIYVDNVRKAQETVSVDNYAWVDCDGLAKHKDDLHYNTKGQLELGKRFARAMIRLLGVKKCGSAAKDCN